MLLAGPTVFRVVKWYLGKSKYQYLKQPKRFLDYFGIVKAFFPDGGVERYMNSLKEEDGSFPPASYGGMFMDGSHFIIFTSPDAAKTILTDQKHFRKHPAIYETVEELLGNGLVTSSGQHWKTQRRLLTPLFHFAKLQHMYPAMINGAEKFIQELERDEETGIVTIRGNTKFKTVTARIIIDAIFGGEFDRVQMQTLFDQLIKAFEVAFNFRMLLGPMYRIVPIPYSLFGMKSLTSIKKTIYTLVNDHLMLKKKNFVDGKDLISLLLTEQSRTGDHMADDDIIAEIQTFLFAGIDTTSNLLAWAVQCIGQHPKVEAKLQAELDEFFKQPETERDFSSLKYTYAVIQEVQRFYPAAPWLEKLTTEDVVVDGVRVPANTTTLILKHALHMDPKEWKSPDEFNPERFLSEAKRRHPFSYVPFSAGPRNCIGRNFALQETTIILAYLLHAFSIQVIKPGRMTFEGPIAPYGMLIHLKPRE